MQVFKRVILINNTQGVLFWFRMYQIVANNVEITILSQQVFTDIEFALLSYHINNVQLLLDRMKADCEIVELRLNDGTL